MKFLFFKILKYINYSSPECRLVPNRPLNIVWELTNTTNTTSTNNTNNSNSSTTTITSNNNNNNNNNNPSLNYAQFQQQIEDLKQKLLNQNQLEQNYLSKQLENDLSQARAYINRQLNKEQQKQQTNEQSNENLANNTNNSNIQSYFHLCKSFVHQMGFLSWEKRQSFNLLHKSSQLLRELKSLDDQTWLVCFF